MHDNRDYSDTYRTDIAVYSFRGYTVLRFHKERKELEIGKDANMCSFIKEDLNLMSKFLEDCYKFSMGLLPDINHVEVD